MKGNQKILYEHYKAVADNVKKNDGKDYSPAIRANAKEHAKQILESFPELKIKETKSTEKK